MRPYTFFLLILPLLFGACSDNRLGTGEENIFTSYEVIRVDNRTIPFVMDTTHFVPPEKADSCETIYQGGWVTLKENGSYEMAFDIRTTLCEGMDGKSSARTLNYGTYEYDMDEFRSEWEIRLDPDDELPFEEDIFEGELRNSGFNTKIWITMRGKLYVFERMRVR